MYPVVIGVLRLGLKTRPIFVSLSLKGLRSHLSLKGYRSHSQFEYCNDMA